MKTKRIITAVLSICLLITMTFSQGFAAEDKNLTRGEVLKMLLTAADDYNPGVQKEDILKGYEDGELHEELPVTRAEALVMLRRAFGTLPEPSGHNERVMLKKEDFTDIPEWAEVELADVFGAGIAAGEEPGIFSPDEPVSQREMELFIERVFSLFGTNLKDDFYAAVNKETLETLTIKPGRVIAGTLYDMSDKTTEQIDGIIKEIVQNPQESGTKEYKIAALYNSILDTETRNKEGIAPIKEYLELIDSAKTASDLVKIQNTLSNEICIAPFFNFSLTVDLKDSTKYMLYFGTASPSLQKEIYLEENDKASSFLSYMTELFVLGGETKEDAEKMAKDCYELEKVLAEAQMDVSDSSNVDKIYNVFTMQEIEDMFPGLDIASVFEITGLKDTGNIIITDVGMTKAFGEYFTDANVEALKAYAKLTVLSGWGGALNEEFVDASDRFNAEFLGVSGSYTDEERATLQLQNVMGDYLGELYAKKYFSEEAKQDVEKMVQDIISVYRKRLQNNTWMSDETKEKAIYKLDSMGVKIGYPDSFETYIDNTDLKSPQDGGTYFSNMLSITKASAQEVIRLQGETVDKTEWIMYPYTVNACYSPTSNDITFPAAILQAPMYDVNASYEQNLGGIGYIIAHEITHAFDNNGAKFDADGNATDWWTEEDYAAFQELCAKMAEFYDGEEAVPGIPMNGTLTLSENVADQGAVSCITEIAAGLENPDFKTLYESIARSWASTASRDYYTYASQVDVHSADKLRVNRVLVNCDEFYEAFDIKEGDGMYLAPEDRVSIW